MLQALLTSAVLRRNVTQIPDARLATIGGVWGARIPDVDAMHDELTEFDRNVATAANLLPQGAPNVDEPDFPTDLVLNRAFKIKQSRRFEQPDVVAVLRVMENPNSDSARADLLARARRKQELNTQGVKITRGILCAAMAIGELNAPERFGWKNTPTDFGMPVNMKALTNSPWRNTSDVPQAGSKPVSDLVAMDNAAGAYGNTPFTDADMTNTTFLSMLVSGEYQQLALASASFYNQSSLPVAGTPLAKALAERVLGKTINIVDPQYQYVDASANRITGRYTPEDYVVLWRAADANQSINWDFANVPVSEAGIALIGGSDAYGGQLARGPASYTSCDRDELSNARIHTVQEGAPRRYNAAVTAVLDTKY